MQSQLTGVELVSELTPSRIIVQRKEQTTSLSVKCYQWSFGHEVRRNAQSDGGSASRAKHFLSSAGVARDDRRKSDEWNGAGNRDRITSHCHVSHAED